MKHLVVVEINNKYEPIQKATHVIFALLILQFRTEIYVIFNFDNYICMNNDRKIIVYNMLKMY